MALIDPNYLKSVVCIGDETIDGIDWIGSGFLLAIPDELSTNNEYHIFLVTNKHVLEIEPEEEDDIPESLEKIVLKFNPCNGNESVEFDLNLLSKEGEICWQGHPNPEIDVATIPIAFEILQSQGMDQKCLTYDKQVFKLSEMQSAGIMEGDSVFLLGYPLEQVEEFRHHAILRSGVISRIRDVYEGHSWTFLIDAGVFPGSSGGPVISVPTTQTLQGLNTNLESRLIGIARGYLDDFGQNSGLGFVHTVDDILETILEYKKNYSMHKE